MGFRYIRIGVLLGAVFLTGCNSDPKKTSEYIEVLKPLLQENTTVADSMLKQAAVVYNAPDGEADSEVLLRGWEEEIIPLVTHLHQQAALTPVPDPWAKEHGELVDLWGSRATQYRALSEALRAGDTAKWDSARAEIGQITKQEQKWFDSLNQFSSPLGMRVEAYP